MAVKEQKPAFTVVVKGNEYPLCEPTFDIQAKALTKYMFGDGIDPVASGKIIFDGCYLGKDLEEIQKDNALYANICLQAAKVVEIYEGELKKN